MSHHPALDLKAKRAAIRARLFDAIEDYDAAKASGELPDWLAAKVRGLVRDLKKTYTEGWK